MSVEDVVAPHVGAWIEISALSLGAYANTVAPHVGAWIEIRDPTGNRRFWPVAPHVGAWIEIKKKKIFLNLWYSRTPCGCVD